MIEGFAAVFGHYCFGDIRKHPRYIDIKRHNLRLAEGQEYLRRKLQQAGETTHPCYENTNRQGDEGMNINGASISANTLSFNLPRPIEVLFRTEDRLRLLDHKGFESREAAVAFAHELAAKNPGVEFVVYEPAVVVSSDIPTKERKWHAQTAEKAEGHDPR